MQTMNPATEQMLAQYDTLDKNQTAHALETVQSGFKRWSKLSIEARIPPVQALSERLKENKQALAESMTREMGKPVVQSIAEIEKCAELCSYFAENATELLADEIIVTESGKACVTLQPIGSILAIMPWNFPVWQVVRYSIPALLAGNTTLLKHAPNVWGTAQLLQQLYHQAGLTQDIFHLLAIEEEMVETVIAHPSVQGVTLTGSGKAGSAVAALAGKHLKKSVLELGGSDAYIILGDADIEAAAQQCVTGRLLNTGQTCIAAKRFIIVEEIYDIFKKSLLEKMRAATMGDPFDDVDIGPMARADLRQTLHKQVTESIEQGAICLLGGNLPEGRGFYYPPTVLEGVTPEMPAYSEELFGPVAVLYRAVDEADAIRLANDSPYGLGGGIFSADEHRAKALAKEQFESGNVAINSMVTSHPKLPFGGIKQSGYGREQGAYGIREFVNIKTIQQ